MCLVKKTEVITKRLLIKKTKLQVTCICVSFFYKGFCKSQNALHPTDIINKLTSAKSKLKFEHSHLPSPSCSSSFTRRLISFAASRPVLRRLSLIRRLFSVALSRSFSRCSSMKLCRLSLALFCSSARCSTVKFCLFSLFLSCSPSRCSSVRLRLLSLSLSLFRLSTAYFLLVLELLFSNGKFEKSLN